MTSPQETELLITCPICGRDFTPAAMVWSGFSDKLLCPDCLAEEENCGCADD